MYPLHWHSAWHLTAHASRSLMRSRRKVTEGMTVLPSSAPRPPHPAQCLNNDLTAERPGGRLIKPPWEEELTLPMTGSRCKCSRQPNSGRTQGWLCERRRGSSELPRVHAACPAAIHGKQSWALSLTTGIIRAHRPRVMQSEMAAEVGQCPNPRKTVIRPLFLTAVGPQVEDSAQDTTLF